MKTIDVVTTSLQRPELLNLTYRSFFSKITHLPKLRIIINVDPIGEADAEECLKIAKCYTNNVVARLPKKSNFSDAVNWCWAHVQSAYFLHLEDDWLLKKPIDFNCWHKDLITKDVAQSVLIMKRPRIKKELAYSFRPHLGVKKNIQSIGFIPPHLNPEKFVGKTHPKVTSSDFAHSGSYTIEDMGRKWAKANGLQKVAVDQSKWFTRRMNNPFFKIEYQYNLLKWHYQSRYKPCKSS